MPFSDKFQDVYEVGIKAACKDAGAYCERVDEQIFTDSILDRIFNQIAKADVIVADMTGRNPNVFYETGYAHALNKRVILLTQKSADIPFDLKHYPHIVYAGKLTLLKAQLERKIRWCIENPLQPLSDVDLNLDFAINGTPMNEVPTIEINGVNYCNFAIDVHNPLGKVIKPDLFSIALISSRKVLFHEPKVTSAAHMPDGQYIYTLSDLPSIFPFGWASHRVVFEVLGANVVYVDLSLRFFTELGFKDYRFVAEKA